MKHFLSTLAMLLLVMTPAAAQDYAEGLSDEIGQLPLGLKYFMGTEEVAIHLKMMNQYLIKTDDPSQLVFIIPDPVSKTKTGMFLKFNSRGLVEMTSGRYEMTQNQYRDYMPHIESQIRRIKKSGIKTIIESHENNMHIYRDDIQYISFSSIKTGQDYQVELSFTEKNYQDRK